MATFEDFEQQVVDELAKVEASGEELERLTADLALGGEHDDLSGLVDAAIEGNRAPNVLLAVRRVFPDAEEVAKLLQTWEQDANLQDDWAETTSAAALQHAKAFYVLLERDVEPGDRGGKRTLSRLLRKISRALSSHPENSKGEYEIYGDVRALELLGTSKIASVFRGVHLVSGQTVAVRVLRPEFTDSGHLVEALAGASQQMQDIRHPQIASILTPSDRDARPRSRTFFVMEWHGEGSLDQLIGDDDVDMAKRQDVAVKFCQGLAYAHKRGFIHGDLRPPNVLVNNDGEVRVANFLAGQGDLSQRDFADVVKKVANQYYLAPEVESGEAVTVSSDVFALGRLLFRLFTKRGESIYDVMVPQNFKNALDENLGDFPGLAGIIERSTSLSPGDRPVNVSEVLGELHRVGGQLGIDSDPGISALRAQGAWAELVIAQRNVIHGASGPETVAVLRQIANLQEYVLGANQEALAAWADTFRAAPSANIEAQMDRLKSDINTAEAAGTLGAALMDALEGGLFEDRDEQLRLQLKAAALFHHEVGDGAAAIPRYLGALALDPTNQDAFAAVDELYQAQGDWAGLVAVLERWHDTQQDVEDRIDVLLRIAEVNEEDLSDPSGAATTYLRIRALDARHREAFRNLDRLYRELSRWADLSELLAEEIDLAEEEDRKLSLMFSKGQVHETHLDEAGAAVDLYSQILTQSPDHADTIGALESLLAQDIEALRVAGLLEPIYRRHESSSKLADTLEVLLTAIDAADETWVSTLKEIAELREQSEQSADAAFNAYARLHRARPRLVWVWEEIERLAPRSPAPRWEAVVELYRDTILTEREVEEPDNTFVVSLWLQIGRVQDEELQDTDKAIYAYTEVIALEERHQAALDHLERLYQATEQWQRLVEILDIQRQALLDAGDDVGALEVLHRVAGHFENDLAQPGQSIETYQKALEVHGDDPIAVENLERLSHDAAFVLAVASILDPHYTTGERWDELLGILQRRLDLDEALSSEDRAECYVRMANVAEQQQSNADQAFEYFLRAVEADPERDDNHDELARVTAATEKWRNAVTFYDGLLAGGAISDQARHLRLLFNVGGWYRDELTELDDAERRFRQVLELSPKHAAALDALDDLYSQRQQYPELYEILSRKVGIAEEIDGQKHVLFRLARLSDENLSDLDRAIESYQRIVGLDNADHEALDGLISVYDRQANHNALLATLRQRANVEANAPAKIGFLKRMGDLARIELADRTTSLQAYEEALSLEPAQPREILDALRALYLDSGNLVAWFTVLDRCLVHAVDNDQRVGMHLQAAALAKSDTAPEEANPTRHYEAILEMAPYHAVVLPALEATYNETESWERLNDIYRRQFVAIHLKAADLLRERLGRSKDAIKHLKSARKLDPDQIAIIDRLFALYQEAGEWDAVIALVEQKMALMGDDQKAQASLLRQLSRALEQQDKVDQSVDCIVRALRLDPGATETVVVLVGMAVRLGNTAKMLGSAAEILADADQEALYTAVEQVAAASAALEKKDSAAAEKALGEVLGIATVDDEVGLQLVRPVFAQAGAEATMVAALRGFLSAGDGDDSRRRALFLTTADLCESTGDESQAYEVFAAYFGEQPGRQDALDNLLRLGRALDREGEAIGAVEARLAKGIDDNTVAIGLDLMLAHHFEGLEESERAVGHYNAVVTREPHHAEALEALDGLLSGLENWEALRPVLQERVTVTGSTRDRATLKMRLADLLDNYFEGSSEDVVRLCIDVIRGGVAPESDQYIHARETLERIGVSFATPNNETYIQIADVLNEAYRAAGDQDALLALLEQKVGLLEGDDRRQDRYAALVEMSQIAMQSDDLDGGFNYSVRGIREDASDVTLFQQLETISTLLHNTEAIIGVYEEVLQRDDLPSDDFRLELALKCATWTYRKLGRPEEASRAYTRVLELDGENLESIEALEEIYAELGQSDDLYTMLTRHAEHPETEDRQALLKRAAELAEHDLGEPDKAIHCYEQLLEQDGPDTDLLGRLEALYTTTAAHEPLLTTLAYQLDLLREADPGAVPALKMRMGKLAWEDLEDSERAGHHFADALESTETHDAAMLALVQIYEKTEANGDLVDLLQNHLGVVADDATRIELSVKGAQLALTALEDPDAAISFYEDARQLDPDHHEAREALYGLLRGQGRFFDLRVNLEADLQRKEGDVPSQVAIALEMAALAVNPEQLGDIELAQQYLTYALELDPENPEAARLLVKLYIEQGRWDEAAAMLGRMIESAQDVPAQISLLLERGDLFMNSLEQLDNATQDYMGAFQLDQSNQEAFQRLHTLFSQEGNWHDLVILYEYQSAQMEDVTERVENDLKIAAMIREHDVHRERLLEILTNSLALDPPYPLNVKVLLEVINTYYEFGSLQEASAYVDHGLQVLSGTQVESGVLAKLWYFKGLIARGNNLFEEALEAHQRAHDLDPSNLANLIALGHLRYSAGDWSGTIKLLQMALLKQTELSDQQKVDVYFMMGQARLQLGDDRRAKDMFQRILRIDREHQPSIQALEQLG